MICAKNLFEILDIHVEMPDTHNSLDISRIRGRVEFRNVSFAYEHGTPVLKNLNFIVEPGEMIGLAGHSGAGKTTLMNLLCRFYDAQEGIILIDGFDIRNVFFEVPSKTDRHCLPRSLYLQRKCG